MKLGVNVVRLTRPFTGVGRYVECVLREWADMDSPFSEIVLFAHSRIRRDLVDLPLESYREAVRGPRLPDPMWEWASLRAARHEVDMLFCPSYTVPVGYRGPCAVSYLGPAVHPGWNYRAARGFAYDRLHGYSARRAGHVFVCSEAVKRRVVEVFGVDPCRVSTTYLAASRAFRPVTDPDLLKSARERYVGADGPFLLYVGKISGRHHIPQLLEAFAAARRKKGLKHRLVLAGPNTLGLDFPEWSRRLGLGGNLTHVPFVPHLELPALYSAAQASVFPASEAEGFGIPVLEAMACDTPVISTDQGSISEFARGSALLTRDCGVPELEEAIGRMLTDPDLRRSLREKGRRTARSITWRHTARKTLDRLWELAKRRRAGR